MPLNREAITLESGPRSVQDARRWVVEACRELGRDDLAESAELGISELVTNALLHAGPPIAVRLRGTRDHPRVEVFDNSHEPPNTTRWLSDEDALLSTVGRGLGIVARCSYAWGADIHPRGKVVWFEPAARVSEGAEREGDVFDAVHRPGEFDAELVDGVDVLVQGLPLALYDDFQRHYTELRRELRILSLAHGNDYPVASNLTVVFEEYEAEIRLSRGFDQIEAALDSGLERFDVKLTVPASTPATTGTLMDLLELADNFCRAERLLALATTSQQRSFQRWYLGEFVRQGAGKAPRPWRNGTAIRPSSPSTR